MWEGKKEDDRMKQERVAERANHTERHTDNLETNGINI